MHGVCFREPMWRLVMLVWLSDLKLTLADVFKFRFLFATALYQQMAFRTGDKSGIQTECSLPQHWETWFDCSYHYIMAAPQRIAAHACLLKTARSSQLRPFCRHEVGYQKPFLAANHWGRNHRNCCTIWWVMGTTWLIVSKVAWIHERWWQSIMEDENTMTLSPHVLLIFINKVQKPTFFLLIFATDDVHVPRFPHERLKVKW